MNNQENISKNESISKTFSETMQRRQNQICKVVSCKVKKHLLNNLQQEQMKMMFIEAKWIYNWLLSEHKKSEDFDVFKLTQKDVKDIYHLDKDRNVVNVHLNYIKSSMVDSVIHGMCSSIKTLSVLKKKGHKVGKLNFISEYTSINLKQNGVTHKIVSKNRIKIQGIKKPLPVSGLDQIIGSVPYEIANAKLIGRNGDYYVNLTIFYDAVEYEKYRRKKYDKPYINKQIGIDFGCETSFTLSNGEKLNSYVEETDHLKRLQRKLSRQKKGSNNRWKTILKIRKEYQRLTNLKDDYANKLVYRFLTENEQIIIQDEQLNAWKRRHGKKIQHSVLGRVKARLIQHKGQVFVLNRFVPTTKLCRDCGHIHSTIKIWDREFVCPSCGVVYDRDVHASENMVWIYNNLVGVDGTEFKRADFEEQLDYMFNGQIKG